MLYRKTFYKHSLQKITLYTDFLMFTRYSTHGLLSMEDVHLRYSLLLGHLQICNTYDHIRLSREFLKIEDLPQFLYAWKIEKTGFSKTFKDLFSQRNLMKVAYPKKDSGRHSRI